MSGVIHRRRFAVAPYHLEATLESGQAFRWERHDNAWESVVGHRWVRLVSTADGIEAASGADPGDWRWLRDYLGLEDDWSAIVATFPNDPWLAEALREWRGLRLLRQDPWECLASFILSSTKQIVQIRQIVAELCRRYGQPVAVPGGSTNPVHAFPTAEALAGAGEAALRRCRMGFRARYLADTARAVAEGRVDLARLRNLDLAEARERLMDLPGVGRKIADCVLLFACGFGQAFPIDVWVQRVLVDHYFDGRDPGPARVREFSERHFGPQAGYAQQYLFHHVRFRAGRVASRTGSRVGS